jgi:hypothetical protein
MDPLKVVCVNDAGRPNDVPTSRWVKKGENYTIIKVDKMLVQNSILGCKLAEINNDDLFPYTHFALSRFRPLTEDEQMAETSVEELIKELDVVPVEHK